MVEKTSDVAQNFQIVQNMLKYMQTLPDEKKGLYQELMQQKFQNAFDFSQYTPE